MLSTTVPKMNERITELYVQANKYASEAGFKKYDKAGDVNWQWEDTVFEKFAELIVDECLAMCAVDSDEGSLDYKRGVIFAMNRCQKNILDHFGVEE